MLPCRMALVFYISVHAPVAVLATECPPPSGETVEHLITAATLPELNETLDAAGKHAALRALYELRRFDFAQTAAAERRYLRKLPKTPTELQCIYSLTYRDP